MNMYITPTYLILHCSFENFDSQFNSSWREMYAHITDQKCDF